MNRFVLCLLVMAGVTYLVRAVPFVAFRRKVRNRFFRSFLYYVPYAVLTAMTVPAALFATESPVIAGCGLLTAGILAYRGRGLVIVSLSACAAAFAAWGITSLIG
ncbi:MAG: AzlD domain-containing protein [Lachnospiraceae bacterium]|nr:AzlD domain-containing protein [Lachnospiraceae bacterium]